MQSECFNLTALAKIYSEAESQGDCTIAFNIKNGRGRFLFMMFFSEDDAASKDKIWIYMRNTRVMLNRKTYGSHRKGDFKIFLSKEDQQKFRKELEIENAQNGNFDFGRFFSDLNEAIPPTIPLTHKIEALRDGWKEASDKLPKEIIEDRYKTTLIGPRRVSNGKPRDRTLRKLYLHTNEPAYIISRFISQLKSANLTVAWTADSKMTPYRISEFSDDLMR